MSTLIISFLSATTVNYYYYYYFLLNHTSIIELNNSFYNNLKALIAIQLIFYFSRSSRGLNPN